MIKYTLAIAAVIFLAFACEYGSIKQKNDSVNKEMNHANSIDVSPRLIGCWRLSKIAFDLKDIDDESKWRDKKNGTILLLRDDGKFMKWFGDYMDVGTFETHNDSLFLNFKDGDEIGAFKLNTLTSMDMIIINDSSSIPIEKYRKQSKEIYSFWKAKF